MLLGLGPAGQFRLCGQRGYCALWVGNAIGLGGGPHRATDRDDGGGGPVCSQALVSECPSGTNWRDHNRRRRGATGRKLSGGRFEVDLLDLKFLDTYTFSGGESSFHTVSAGAHGDEEEFVEGFIVDDVRDGDCRQTTLMRCTLRRWRGWHIGAFGPHVTERTSKTWRRSSTCVWNTTD